MSALVRSSALVDRRGDLAVAIVATTIGITCVIGITASGVRPLLPLAVAMAAVVFVMIAVRPVLGLYLVFAVTPLLAGIDRGTLVPTLRPSEAVAALVVSALVARAVWIGIARGWARPTILPMDLAVVLLAVVGSFVPILWLAARGQPIEADDVLYGLTLWKFVAIFALARFAARTEREIAWCLRISLGVAAIVAVIGILQSLQVPGVTTFLTSYYAPYGNVQSVLNGRGGSTLSLPIAAADLLTFNLAIAIGFFSRSRGGARSAVLLALMGLLLVGVMAAGEFSGMLGALIGLIVASLIVRRGRLLAYATPAFLIGSIALRSVIATRLEGFRSASGIPVSWSGRIRNLTTYFWPELSNGNAFLLGVRPAARVPVASQASGYVWIESGYMWLLWSGGLPLLLAFVWFVWQGIRHCLALVRRSDGAVAVLGLACVVGLVVVAALMPVDPHLTYRGSAELLFLLLGLACSRAASLARER